MLGVDPCEFGGQVLELLWLTVCYRGLIADKKDLSIGEEEIERNLNYNPPALKSLEEIMDMDKDDESLVKYKETLLGGVTEMADTSLPTVQVTRMTLLCDGAAEPTTLDLTGDLAALKETPIDLKEGTVYRLKIDFKVNREIVSGLKYHHVIKRKGITVDKASYMVGSYGPKAEEHEFISPRDEAAKGMISHALFDVQSKFLDDDKNVHLEWEWQYCVKKDWN